jgi:hypothetical protein
LFYNDIALIEFANDFVFSETIHPTCLWTQANEDLLINKSVISTSGFGVEGAGFAKLKIHTPKEKPLNTVNIFSMNIIQKSQYPHR